MSYREPLEIVRGEMQYLFDQAGRKYLDAYNNVPHVGHCHPRVVEAATRQMSMLNTNTRYLHQLQIDYAEKLTNTLPDRLSTCFFVNSASEANELALRMARCYSKRNAVVVQEASYHGHTSSLIDVSPYKHDGPGGKGAPPWVHKVALPDTFRGPIPSSITGPDRVNACGDAYADQVAESFSKAIDGPHAPAAFLAETWPSVGGQIVPPPNYLPLVYKAARAHGIVTIADEVQTAFGRIGSHFWAFERDGVEPDIVVMGKPIGNGHPIGAVVTTQEIAEAFDNGMEFFSTFGGNTVSCAIGIAVLNVLEDERQQANAVDAGNSLAVGFRRLCEHFSLIGDVRGSGLFWGIELVTDEALTPAASEATLIVNRLRQRGTLIGTDGPNHNVLKIRPPMPFDTSDAERLIAQLDEILTEEFV